jgi:hypothetical protein
MTALKIPADETKELLEIRVYLHIDKVMSQ